MRHPQLPPLQMSLPARPQMHEVESAISETHKSPVDDYAPPSPARRSSEQVATSLLPSLSPQPTHTDAYVRWPSSIYLQFLFFFIIITILPLVFIGNMRYSGSIKAPRHLAEFTSAYPRLTPQLTAALGSFLTASVKWALAGVVTIRAQKHFQRVRPMFKIEVYSALKNGGIAWSWKTRPWWTFWTFVVVVLCGLLTSGFVALLSPLPIKATTYIGPGSAVELKELDLASDNSSCYQWYSQAIEEMYGGNITNCYSAIRYRTSNLVYSTCRYVDPLGDVITSAKSGMMPEFESAVRKRRVPDFIYSFTQLANTHLYGTTAGTLPTGPDGVGVLSEEGFPDISNTTLSYDYTLNLQGIWANVSCSYLDPARSHLTFSLNETTSMISYGVDCPVNQTGMIYGTYVGAGENGRIITGACYGNTKDTISIYLRSFSKPEDLDYTVTNPNITTDFPYAGIDSMVCALAPLVGPVEATYRADLAAIKTTPSNTTYTPFTKMSNLTADIVIQGLEQVLASIDLGQTEWNGNAFGEVIRNVALSYGNLTGQEKSPIVQNLVANAIKGIFEYRVTRQRLVLTAYVGEPLSPSCYRVVNGSLTETMIGWDFKWNTAIGLIPLWIISLACLGVTIWTMLRRGTLTVFDPTSPISLVAAASNGKLRLVDEKDLHAIGDPEDEAVMNTKVIYGYYEGRWGLKAE